jgi:quinol monooxygenase YgiN
MYPPDGEHNTLILKVMSRLVFVVLCSAAVLAQGQSKQEKPLYVVTHIDVYPNFAADTAALLKQFSSDSMKDAGAVRFEVLRDVERTNHFTVVEVWKSRNDYEAHLVAAHSKPFRDKLQPMLGSPFDERLSFLVP